MHLLRALALLLVCALAAACTTYANIPEQKSDVAQNNPNDQTVRDVELAALRAALADRPLPGRFQVLLPELTTQDTYERLVPRLGDGAVYSLEGPRPGLPVVEARYVRIRGYLAQVDVIRPTPGPLPAASDVPPEEGGPLMADLHYQLVTVYLRHGIVDGWNVTRLRPWRMPVEEALRLSAEEYKRAE